MISNSHSELATPTRSTRASVDGSTGFARYSDRGGAAERQKTFVARGVRKFLDDSARDFRRIHKWRSSTTRHLEHAFHVASNKPILESRLLSVISLGLVITLGIAFLISAGGRSNTGAFLYLGIAGGVFAFLILQATYLPLTKLMLLLLELLVVAIYGLRGLLLLLGQFLLLIPLSGLFLVTRLVQLWRGIFFTCPARGCAYRGLPAYVCPDCDEPNEQLWPNLYGLLWHLCVRCGRRLPTLAVLGRNELKRKCGKAGCRWPLDGRHAGKVPERLVAIVGGPTSGKSCYLTMAAGQIVDGSAGGWGGIHGEIDVPDQQQSFEREWGLLRRGTALAKTAEISRAFLMYVKNGDGRYQLYLYDAPGEEFASISGMSGQEYFPLVEGFILLVDPESFDAVGGSGLSRGRMSFQSVVNSTLVKAIAEMPRGAGGKVDKRVAIVISKADIPAVRERIGDIQQGRISGQICRQAIIDWGGRNAIQAVENLFSEVYYFACSPLGREAGAQPGEPFRGRGLLEPLHWILAKD
jgi:hypothetical protein